MPTDENSARVCVAALYRFARIADCDRLRARLEQLCVEQSIKGTILIAPEGINGTIAGSRDRVDKVLIHIRTWPGCVDLDVKFSTADKAPFHRLKVRIKREIVTMGEPGIDPTTQAGTYVEPRDWNALIDDADTILIDTRNDYEVALGSFAGAINPGTVKFRDFPAWFDRERNRLLGFGKPPKVAMFCTGGIRCEKASALLKREGVEEVYHLKGGILAYLEAMPAAASRWQGECFVFDQRVAIGHDLSEGSHELCFGCRSPISHEARQSLLYEPGASCPACHAERSEGQRASSRERHRQEVLAAADGRAHVGATVSRGSDKNVG